MASGPFVPSFVRIRQTSARLVGGRRSVPAKITSPIDLPRSCLMLCSPITHLIASKMLLFPQPFGPTTAEMPGGKSITDFSGNDLNPEISRRFNRIRQACRGPEAYLLRQVLNWEKMSNVGEF